MGRSTAVAFVASDVELAAKGDELAFARLIDAYHAELARIAFAIVGEHAIADDAVQSAWVKAWRKLPSLRDSSRVRYWLISICVNEARQALRSRRRVDVLELTIDQPAADRSDPALGVGRLDLHRALNRLSGDDRALLTLRYVADLNANEIAAITGRSASGTRVRLSRLTAKLRAELNR
jgi:RNA polymerase sigma-70 factor, ECF subfamily